MSTIKLLFVMDGTVPVIAAKVFATDGFDQNDALEKGAYEVLVREVEDNVGGIPATWVVANINENGGIDGVFPATSEGDAQDIATEYGELADYVDGPKYIDPNHFVVTVDEGADEGYSHAFKL